MYSSLAVISMFFVGMVIGCVIGILWESIDNDLNNSFMREWLNKGGSNDAS